MTSVTGARITTKPRAVTGRYDHAKDRSTRTKRVFRGLELLIGDADHMIINAMIDDQPEDFFGVSINFRAGEEEM